MIDPRPRIASAAAGSLRSMPVANEASIVVTGASGPRVSSGEVRNSRRSINSRTSAMGTPSRTRSVIRASSLVATTPSGPRTSLTTLTTASVSSAASSVAISGPSARTNVAPSNGWRVSERLETVSGVPSEPTLGEISGGVGLSMPNATAIGFRADRRPDVSRCNSCRAAPVRVRTSTPESTRLAKTRPRSSCTRSWRCAARC